MTVGAVTAHSLHYTTIIYISPECISPDNVSPEYISPLYSKLNKSLVFVYEKKLEHGTVFRVQFTRIQWQYDSLCCSFIGVQRVHQSEMHQSTAKEYIAPR